MAHAGQTLNDQAADWLAKLQRDEVSAAERKELEHWLDSHPAHAVAFARAEFAWERAERLRAIPESARSFDAMPFWLRLTKKHWAIAASLALVTTFAAVWYLGAQRHVYVTGLGERRSLVLEDGSQINLNTSSRLEVHFDGDARQVRLLQGEALFNVARDLRRPFTVAVGNTAVRAIGTAFNVRLLRNEVIEVTVTEGAVTVDHDRIDAGSAVVAAAGMINHVSLTKDDVRRRVAWREGVIELKGETLEQAIEEFNRYRKTKLIVADPAIAGLRIGGRFETDDADKFVHALKANFAIRSVDAEGGTYLLGPQAVSRDISTSR